MITSADWRMRRPVSLSTKSPIQMAGPVSSSSSFRPAPTVDGVGTGDLPCESKREVCLGPGARSPKSGAYLRKLLPPPAAETSSTGSRGAARPASSRFYDEMNHRAVKTFVLEMNATLDQANAALRRQHLPLVFETSIQRRDNSPS